MLFNNSDVRTLSLNCTSVLVVYTRASWFPSLMICEVELRLQEVGQQADGASHCHGSQKCFLRPVAISVFCRRDILRGCVLAQQSQKASKLVLRELCLQYSVVPI